MQLKFFHKSNVNRSGQPALEECLFSRGQLGLVKGIERISLLVTVTDPMQLDNKGSALKSCKAIKMWKLSVK